MTRQEIAQNLLYLLQISGVNPAKYRFLQQVQKWVDDRLGSKGPLSPREGQQQVLRGLPGIRDSVKELVGKQIDALARKFAATHDLKVKEEIERLARDYGKLCEPWRFVVK